MSNYRCCENCINCVKNDRAQWYNCYIHIKYRDGVEKTFRTSMTGYTPKENICKFYKRKEETNADKQE